MSFHSINPLKKSVKKANTRYWQFLLTYFQSKSEKKKQFSKNKYLQSFHRPFVWEFFFLWPSNKESSLFQYRFRIADPGKTTKQQKSGHKATNVSLDDPKKLQLMFCKSIQEEETIGWWNRFLHKIFTLFQLLLQQSGYIIVWKNEFYWPYGLWQWTKIINFHFSPLQNRHKFLNENSYLFCHQLSNKYLDKWKNPNGDKNEPII